MVRLRFILFLVSGLLLTNSAALAQDSSAKATLCKPQPALKTCPVTPGPACQGILRKAYSVGCRNKRGKSLLDGGCQCKGYCGYQCLQGCQADPECTWDKTKKRCLNAATGLPSGPLKVCKETLTPTTTPSRTPSNAPTIKTATPTQPSLEPTSAPSQSPTMSYCRSDRKFLDVVNNPERESVVSLSMSANGMMVLFSSRAYEYEGGKNYDFLWATRKKSNGDWSTQLVESYESDDYIEISGALSGNGKYLISRKSVFHGMAANTTISFYKLDSKNSFKKQQKSFTYPTLKMVGTWIDSNGAHAGISYLTVNSFPLTYNNVNFIRRNNAWTVEWIQPLRIDSTSRDGNTALSLDISVEPQKHRRIYVRKGKQWTLQAPDVLGTTGPETDRELMYRGLPASGFSTNGDAIVLGGLIASDDYSDMVIRESGAWVMERSGKGNWTQVGPKIGGEDNLYDARATAISDNLKTIVMSNGQEPQGFKVFRKNGSTWTQTGSKVLTTRCCTNIWLSADGTTVLTDLPPTLWRC